MWMLDSGASMHFIFTMSDFADFHYYNVQQPLYMADGVTYMTGEGTVFLALESGRTMKLTSIAFIPNLTNKLVSMGALLQDGMLACASTANIFFYRKNELVIAFKPRNIGDTIYVIYLQPLLA